VLASNTLEAPSSGGVVVACAVDDEEAMVAVEVDVEVAIVVAGSAALSW